MIKRLDRFIFSYQGNKYLESKKNLPLENINYDFIIEPFGGIFGFSRAFAEKHQNFNGKFLINDVNVDIINFYKNLQSDFNKTTLDISSYINAIDGQCFSDSNFTQLIRQENYITKLICQSNNINVFKRRISRTKCSNFLDKKDIYIEFLKKCEFFCMDYLEFLNMVDLTTNGKKLVFFDPPYFLSYNSGYVNTSVNGVRQDCSKIYIDILNYFEKSKNDIYFIINYTSLMDYIFGKYFYKKYGKSYSNTGKNKAEHIVYRKIL